MRPPPSACFNLQAEKGSKKTDFLFPGYRQPGFRLSSLARCVAVDLGYFTVLANEGQRVLDITRYNTKGLVTCSDSYEYQQFLRCTASVHRPAYDPPRLRCRNHFSPVICYFTLNLLQIQDLETRSSVMIASRILLCLRSRFFQLL